METRASIRATGGGPRAVLRRLAVWGAAALILSGASVLWTTPAEAGHGGSGIYCGIHRGHFAPGHYRRHAAGYVVAGPAGYLFYTQPAYARLGRVYHGRPALFISGGYFYPHYVGYGPVLEPYGYLAISGLRFGRTHLGFQIGLPAFPTVGVGFLTGPTYRVHLHGRRPHPHHRYW